MERTLSDLEWCFRTALEQGCCINIIITPPDYLMKEKDNE